MTDIFVNYRTGDETFAAVLVDELMVEKFGGDVIFRDTRSIPLGAEFRDNLWGSLAESKVLLVVIGQRWLTLEKDGVRRLDMPDDYVRREIAYALNEHKQVVPVLIGDVQLPRESQLPPDIKDLAFRQYVRLHPRNAHRDARMLVNELAVLLAQDRTDPVVSMDELAEAIKPARTCSLIAVKVENFTSMTDPMQAIARGGLYDVLRIAARRACLPWKELVVKDRVDGVLVLAPDPTSPVALVSNLARALDELLLERANRGDRTLRLRFAAHRGLATQDADGWTGQAVSLVWRLADASGLGEVFAAEPRVRLVLVVSEGFYNDVIAPDPGSIDPSVFLPLRFDPAGGTAWVAVPGWSAPPGLATPAPESREGQDRQPSAPQGPAGHPTTPGNVAKSVGILFTGSPRIHIQGDQVGIKKVYPRRQNDA